MAHGEGIKQEQGNIAETGELVTKDVGQLRLVSTTEQAISQHRIMALGHGTQEHQVPARAQVRDWDWPQKSPRHNRQGPRSETTLRK
jgi:hypothetical protein